MMEPTLVVMAAGMGSRYGGLKQIDPVGDNGEIIIDFSLYDAYRAGFRKAVFIIRKENEEAFCDILDAKAGSKMDIQYAYQELDDLPEGYSVPDGRKKPWGTAHAVYSSRSLVSGPFCVINADDYYGEDSFRVMYDFLASADSRSEGSYAMVGYQLDKTMTEFGSVSRGVCQTEDGKLVRIDERTKIMWRDGESCYSEDDGETWIPVDRESTVSMNFWGFTGRFMEELCTMVKPALDKILKSNPEKGEIYLPAMVMELMEAGKASVTVLPCDAKWYGVTYPDDKASVKKAMASMKADGTYPASLW